LAIPPPSALRSQLSNRQQAAQAQRLRSQGYIVNAIADRVRVMILHVNSPHIW
jgi:hypothetical protein